MCRLHLGHRHHLTAQVRGRRWDPFCARCSLQCAAQAQLAHMRLCLGCSGRSMSGLRLTDISSDPETSLDEVSHLVEAPQRGADSLEEAEMFAVMWIPEMSSVNIKVGEVFPEGRTTNGGWSLWLARVIPVDRSQYTCNECKATASEHDRECRYHRQMLCAWCNMYPCKHGRECTRKNFACHYCHYNITGHCWQRFGCQALQAQPT